MNLDTDQWTDVTPTGMAHPNRYYGVSVWNSKIIYFGGVYDPTSTSNQNVVTEVDVSGSTYTRIVKIANGTSGSPPGRIQPGCAVYGNNFYIFGGYNGSYFNDLWELNLLSYSWTSKTYTGSPPARANHQGVVYNDKFYLFGGYTFNSNGHSNQLWELNLTTFVFSSISTYQSSLWFWFWALRQCHVYIWRCNFRTRENDTWKLILPQTELAKLGDLDDVTTVGAQTNYALVYNGTSWAPAAQSGSSSSSSEYYSAHIQNISDIGLYGGYTITDSENVIINLMRHKHSHSSR